MAKISGGFSTISLLGSTGKTGQKVLRQLLGRDEHLLQIYVRSVSKLSDIFPGIENNPKVTIFVGSAQNHQTIKDCLSHARIIICTLGSNDYSPGTTILRESAASIVAALKEMKRESLDWQPPRMIYLSSASMNDRFAAARPPGVDWLIKTAFQSGYVDLIAAEAILLNEPALVSLLRVQPGVLIAEEGTGYEISIESVRLAASYEDLGCAIAELALEREYDSLDQVGVSSKGGDRAVRYAPTILGRILAALLTLYVPGGSYILRAFTGQQ